MKRLSIKDVVTRVCVGVLVVLAVTVVARILNQNLLIERFHINNSLTNFIVSGNFETPEAEHAKIDIDWASLYPFENPADNQRTETTMSSEGDESVTLPERVIAPIQALAEAYATTNLVGYQKITESERRYENCLSWNLDPMEEYNSIQKLENGYLISYMPPLDVTPNINAVNGFYDFCQSQDIDFLYVQAPGKLSKYEDTDICGTLDFSNQIGDDLINGILEHGVPTLDLREKINEDGLSHRPLFFKTDHHWTMETGLWATGKIANTLNKLCHLKFDMNTFESQNYSKIVYEKSFLGSKGTKLTLAQADPEDISLLFPVFDTNLSIQIPTCECQ